MRDFMAISKALADETRVRILMALRGTELCVCQRIELTGLAPSTVSKHLALLSQARLVDARKKQRWIYYRLSGKDGQRNALAALKWLRSALEDSPLIAEDSKRLASILKTCPEDLCRKQAAR